MFECIIYNPYMHYHLQPIGLVKTLSGIPFSNFQDGMLRTVYDIYFQRTVAFLISPLYVILLISRLFPEFVSNLVIFANFGDK